MNINELIISTLNRFKIPIRYRQYSGSEDTYITFFELNNYDENYSDDRNETEVHSLQIDLWSKTDITQLKKDIKKALKEQFEDVQYTDMYESKERIYHIVFRCYYNEEMEEC